MAAIKSVPQHKFGRIIRFQIAADGKIVIETDTERQITNFTPPGTWNTSAATTEEIGANVFWRDASGVRLGWNGYYGYSVVSQYPFDRAHLMRMSGLPVGFEQRWFYLDGIRYGSSQVISGMCLADGPDPLAPLETIQFVLYASNDGTDVRFYKKPVRDLTPGIANAFAQFGATHALVDDLGIADGHWEFPIFFNRSGTKAVGLYNGGTNLGGGIETYLEYVWTIDSNQTSAIKAVEIGGGIPTLGFNHAIQTGSDLAGAGTVVPSMDITTTSGDSYATVAPLKLAAQYAGDTLVHLEVDLSGVSLFEVGTYHFSSGDSKNDAISNPSAPNKFPNSVYTEKTSFSADVGHSFSAPGLTISGGGNIDTIIGSLSASLTDDAYDTYTVTTDFTRDVTYIVWHYADLEGQFYVWSEIRETLSGSRESGRSGTYTHTLKAKTPLGGTQVIHTFSPIPYSAVAEGPEPNPGITNGNFVGNSGTFGHTNSLWIPKALKTSPYESGAAGGTPFTTPWNSAFVESWIANGIHFSVQNRFSPVSTKQDGLIFVINFTDNAPISSRRSDTPLDSEHAGLANITGIGQFNFRFNFLSSDPEMPTPTIGFATGSDVDSVLINGKLSEDVVSTSRIK